MTATLELKLPDSVDLSEFDIKMTLAAKMYEDGTLSGGQAAQAAWHASLRGRRTKAALG